MPTPLEEILMNTYMEGMTSYLKERPGEFEEAVRLAISDRQPLGWRAAWLIWSCMEVNDLLVKKHTRKFLSAIKGKPDGHKRELIKILMKLKLTERQESGLFDECVTLWEQINGAPSIRYTAFKFIRQTADKYPELKKEIAFLFQDHYIAPLSPGAKHSILKMLKEDGYHPKETK